LSELQAAVLRVQLQRLDEQITCRERNARWLDRQLGAIAGIVPQAHDPRVTRHPHYMYMFRYDAAEFGGLPRQEFVDQLVAQGIPAFVAYPAVPRTPVFREGSFGPRWRPGELPDYSRVSCPVSEDLGDNVVWLHHRTLLAAESELQQLADAVHVLQAAPVRTAGGR